MQDYAPVAYFVFFNFGKHATAPWILAHRPTPWLGRFGVSHKCAETSARTLKPAVTAAVSPGNHLGGHGCTEQS